MEIPTQLNELLNSIISVIIIPLLPVVAAFLIAFIKQKTSELENQVKNEQLKKYLSIAENAVTTAVAAVNQTYVDELKKKNGVLSAEEQKTAFRMAKEKALSILGDAAVEVLQQSCKDFDIWLENKIESYVYQFKGAQSRMTVPKLNTW